MQQIIVNKGAVKNDKLQLCSINGGHITYHTQIGKEDSFICYTIPTTSMAHKTF